jgi:hypothetical protein
MSEWISREDFEGQMNTTFTAYFTEDAPTPLELIEVTERRRRRDHESFSLVLRGPVNGPLVQELLTVEHPRLGTFDLSLSPIAQDANGLQYEALFFRKMTGETTGVA